MRLTDAYALQDEIHKSKMKNPHKDAKVAKNHVFEHEHFMRMVTLQPTAQEAVVRCKDCIHLNSYYVECDKGHNPKPPYDKWFCADGEEGTDDA